MGLFKPAWMSDNLDKALKAVEKENNQQKLYEIVEDAMDIEVRLLAAVKLNDQSLAQDTYVQAARSSNKNVCFVAIDYLTNQNGLAYVVTNSSDGDVCEKALNGIIDQNLLADLAIAEYKAYSSALYLRMLAAKKITDQDVLARLAKYDPPKEPYYSTASKIDVPPYAAERITDQDLLTDVAKKAPYALARAVAVHNLTDQVVLTDVAKNDTDGFVRMAAAEKINDQVLLQKTYVELAKNNLSFKVRVAAVKKLTDQDVLVDVAKNDTEEYVREAANIKLHALRDGSVQTDNR